MQNSDFKVVFSNDFNRKLSDLVFYIIYKFCNPGSGRKLMYKLISSAESLCSFPERHPIIFKEKTKGYEARKFVVDKYIISYYVDTKNRIVYINDLISNL